MANGGDIYIRYNTADDGKTRPVPNGTAFWESTSLWLTNGGGVAQVGTQDTINIRVDNHGTAVRTNVQVQVWVADPTVGFQPTSGRIAGSPNPFDALQEPLTIPSIDPGGFGVATINWTPQAANPHVCIGANCFVQTGTPEGVQFVAGDTGFDARTDQHMGQRNISIAAAKQMGGVMRFPFQVANAGGEDDRYTLTVEEVRGEAGLDILAREQVLQHPFATVRGIDPVELLRLRAEADCGELGQPLERTLLDKGASPILVDSDHIYDLHPSQNPAKQFGLISHNLLPGGGDPKFSERGGGNGVREGAVEARTGNLVPVALEVVLADDTAAGGTHTFQINQFDHHGTLVGGLRVHALALSDELLNPCGTNN